jgi:predicted MFS family arabinose efflux permease
MKALVWRMMGLAAGVLLLASAVLSLQVLRDFEAGFAPLMSAADREVGVSILRTFEKALSAGIPFEALEGVVPYLDTVRRDHPKLVYLWITDPSGVQRYASTAPAFPDADRVQQQLRAWGDAPRSTVIGPYLHTVLPVEFSGRRVGWLHLGQRNDLAQQKLREVAVDVLTVLVVAVLAALELMRALLGMTLITPLARLRAALARLRDGDLDWALPTGSGAGWGRISQQLNTLVAALHTRYHGLSDGAAAAVRQRLGDTVRLRAAQAAPVPIVVAALDDIRWPFFLLIFADSLSLSFFPVYAAGFQSSAFGLSSQLTSSVPISVFMLVWALAMPWAGEWCDRVGYRRAFGWGAGITTLGLLLTASAQTFSDLLLWRALTAVGYGMVFVTTQAYVAQHTPAGQRTRGMAMFLSTFFAGSLAGAAVGGILVDRLGARPTFLLSALLSVLAALFVQHYLQARSGQGGPPRRLQWADVWALLRHRQFVSITFLTAIPAKIALTGFLYYSVPLYLQSIGASQAGTGRMMMAYGLVIIFLAPQIARLADRLGHRRLFVVAGGYLSALGMFVTYFDAGVLGLLISITGLGIAHAVGVSPQLALIGECCADAAKQTGQAALTGVFRLLERLGNVLGPLFAGVLIAHFGFQGAFYGVGLMSLLATTWFVLVWREAASAEGTSA